VHRLRRARIEVEDRQPAVRQRGTATRGVARTLEAAAAVRAAVREPAVDAAQGVEQPMFEWSDDSCDTTHAAPIIVAMSAPI
jgi:hypothetical protein